MAGGLLNLVAEGQQNIYLNKDPKISFWNKWRAAYKAYTNFGLQKFRTDYTGQQTLSLTTDSFFDFEIKRDADILVDSFLNITLPNIWSPIYPPQEVTQSDGSTLWTDWAPYEFRWVRYVGAQMIRSIEFFVGGQTIQRYSGQYLLSAVQRDFNGTKRALFGEMIGDVAEMVDPANANGRAHAYPNAYYTSNPAGPQPSISARTLSIPLNAFYCLNTQMAFPLVATQYNLLTVRVTFRPVRDWFQIRDVTDYANNFPYVQPNFNNSLMGMWRFLQPPPDVAINQGSYIDQRTLWNAEIYLQNTYAFLSNVEREEFAKSAELVYPLRNVRELVFYDVAGTHREELNSTGMVTGWMFYFQRSDVNLRNEWSNYTNWPYMDVQPVNVVAAPDEGVYPVIDPSGNPVTIGPGINEDGVPTGLFINQDYNPANIKQILLSLGFLFDGTYRENQQPFNVYNYIEKYTRTAGGGRTDGLLVYNFCLNSDAALMQPSGAQSMSPYNKIVFEFTTIIPPVDVNAQTLQICNGGEIIGINKSFFNLYEHNFNLIVFEETFNQLIFSSGNCALQYQLSG